MRNPFRYLLIIAAVMSFAIMSLLVTGASDSEFANEPDLPPYRVLGREVSKEEFMARRAEAIGKLRGADKDTPFDAHARQRALGEMDKQQELITKMPASLQKNALLAPWVPLGPAPIPNGQTVTVSTPVSGRTVSIAIHPTNPSIVYVGAAQGGLYRTTDGGTTWTPLMDGALSLAIGAIAIAPSQPDTIYVGTGEVGFAQDSFFGVGVYRIDNASTAAPVISGPFNQDAGAVDVFTGRGIGEIVVHPTLPGTIFVASGSGVGGIGASANNVLPARGLFRSTNANTATPTFTKMVMTGPAAQDRAIVDIAMDPGNPDLVLCTLADTFALNEGGVFRSTNALSAVPSFTRTFIAGNGTSNSRTELTLHRDTGSGVVTVYAGSGFNGGTVQRSTDGGATWAQRIDNNFCTAQCFYDIAIAVDPTDVNRLYLGGSPNLPFGISTNGGTSFTSSSVGLHVDSHAITVAPSLPSTVYFSSDGGIYKSTDSGANWTPLNNTMYSATQFMSLAVHPTDRYFTIGGTQDNGTNFYQPSQLWTNTEGGDGGYTQIDQNAANNTNVTMYHTFFNQTNAMGYSRSTNAGNTWQFFGCGFGGSTANGMTCAATAIQFYAPMERGPGNPNTLYFGSDVLYRSANSGTTVAKVSQEPIQAGAAISAIGIAPQDDNVRIVGETNGNLFGTSTGSAVLTNLDALGAVPNNFIARTVVAPNSTTTAYVTLSAFGVAPVWKTTNLNAVNPTWTAAATGLPLVPVSALVIDPQDPNAIYAGTDIGVYQSLDGGGSWNPYGTGLPRVAVFGAQISNVHRILRIATHGRGMYEIGIPGVGLPVLQAAGDGSSGPGGAAAIVTEACPNGAIDPVENVTVSYSIKNVGGGPTSNLVVTLQPTGGVTSPSGPQNYGAVPAGGTVTRNFSFTSAGNCGDTITLTFQLQDGATNFGNLTVTFVLGPVYTGAPAFSENFDAVVAPVLPAGWATANTGTAPPWATTTAFSDTALNSAATDGTANPGDNSLTTPVIAIPNAPLNGTGPTVQLQFRNNYNTEGGFDGGVLEISINAGAFTDIIAAGGTFVTGGYSGTIGVTDSVLTGRNAWTGSSGGFITTQVNLPPASFGQNAQLRWRTAYDTGTNPAGGGMRVDTISIYTATRICCAPSAASANISGRIVTSAGAPLGGVVMRLSGGSGDTTISDSNGNYRFRNLEANGFYTVTPEFSNYHFSPANRSFSLVGDKTDAVFTAEADAVATANAIDSSEFFVRQQYLDFLGREPEAGGFRYWNEQLGDCRGDASCLRGRRIDVSAAFFESAEFRDTGSFVYRLYRGALGRQLRYDEFAADRAQVVGGPGLEASKAAFANAFVQRSEFAAKYQGNLDGASFVDALLRTMNDGGVDLTSARAALINRYNEGSNLAASRALVVRDLVDNAAFTDAVYNETVVAMQYYGYLRRTPERQGFNFWLDVLNRTGDHRGMVCSFLTSAEYQRRFSSLVTHSNAECGNQ
ncbi:MAG TPA: DUF4214 domain-containing protein [Pyrinomonadaceae bacterium]|nr:DUF4214 domain-containing protein [Pyrinomonadaceae bacterium]